MFIFAPFWARIFNLEKVENDIKKTEKSFFLNIFKINEKKTFPADFVKFLNSKWIFCAFCFVSVCCAGIISYPRLDLSLWIDEDTTLRNNVHGFYRRGADLQDSVYQNLKDGERLDTHVTFSKRLWIEAFWGYSTTNNHFFYSIISKIFLDFWKKNKFHKESKSEIDAKK